MKKSPNLENMFFAIFTKQARIITGLPQTYPNRS
ncbi:hypothetical protein T4A_3119 [Trichinella pseudospiralis]|uniref:Uncharacterized protein n=1 Tax=Trichinella pseudospiralis TaxID=6337 RepID=A0A0V1B1G9_TRIPS|nr:hypothetical protein T4A_3119 [Trichinella pseudospiralis]